MNRYATTLFILLVLYQSKSYSQASKTSFYEGPFVDVQNEAARVKKNILLDFTSPTCKYCMKMEKAIFEDIEISKLINSDFIAYKVDLNDADGKQLVAKYKVNEFPEYVILNDKNILLGRIKGEHRVEEFLKKARKFIASPKLTANKPIDKTKKWWMIWK